MSTNNYFWEFDDTKTRSTLWYIIAFSIVIGLVIWWFFTKQYWMSFIILLIAWLVYFTENNSPDKIWVSIDENWVKIANTNYNFNSISSFQFINKNNEAFLLRFNLNNKWLRYIDVKVSAKVEKDIRPILSNFTEEEDERNLNFSEKFIYLLKL